MQKIRAFICRYLAAAPLPLLGTARTERTSIAFLRAIAEHVSCGVALGSSEFIA